MKYAIMFNRWVASTLFRNLSVRAVKNFNYFYLLDIFFIGYIAVENFFESLIADGKRSRNGKSDMREGRAAKMAATELGVPALKPDVAEPVIGKRHAIVRETCINA